MRLPHRPLRAGGAAVLGLAAIALTGAFAGAQAATATPSAISPQLISIKNSLPATTDRQAGAFTAARMSVEVSLSPRNEAGLTAELQAIYTKGSGQYGKFLAKGQFDARYAPTAAARAAVVSYLRGEGLTATSTDSPFLLRATGPSAKIEAAFHTALSTYVDPHGTSYHSNSKTVSLPASIASTVAGVVGLSNTVRLQSSTIRPLTAAKTTKTTKTTKAAASPAAKSGSSAASCETGYPTTAEFFALVNNNTSFPFGYGAGPGCSGLTPTQTNSIYGAPNAGARAKGAGVTEAVFELSAYQHSDIDTWAKTFYGPGYNPPLVDVTVDGGPLAPVCPTGDTCPTDANEYSGDVEVDADIEQELSVAPDVSHLIVYNAPNDETGQTELAEYTTIANSDAAASISSSWGECENDAGASYAQAENTVFEQMAMQGQSLFSSAGDTGAFGCIRSDGTTIVNSNDPSSQPWVTSVGGTSLESDNPGTNPFPSYPANGTETVWNVDNLCSDQAKAADNDNQGGFFWCANTGAGGGGSSQFWGRPFYQKGPGVTSKSTVYANGSTNCSLASKGTPCREVPDISADADEYTPYAEFCTGSAATPESDCATFSGSQPVPGWFGIGGTSLSSPLWGALIADRDAYTGKRTGNINPLIYSWLNTDPGKYFHDITGIGRAQQAATNNGLFPTTPGYDEATGIGSPKFAAVITTK